MESTLIKDSEGGLYPVRKIGIISAIREMGDGKFGFNILGSTHTSQITSRSRKGAIKRLNFIRQTICKVRLGVKGRDNNIVEYASYIVDPNDPQAGFTIPIWSIEHVGAMMKESAAPEFKLRMSYMSGHSITQPITFGFGEGAKFKNRKEASAALKSYRGFLIYQLEQVGDII